MVYIVEDIVRDILSRLPTRDLCRCNCVSLQWHRSLIPPILAQRPKIAFFCFHESSNRCSFFSFSNDSHLTPDDTEDHSQLPLNRFLHHGQIQQSYSYLGFCNGAALFTLHAKWWCNISNLAVYNSFTHKRSIFHLPPRFKSKPFETDWFFFLAFDHRYSSHHFKVVYFRDGSEPMVYSSETKRWRKLKLSETQYNFKSNSGISYCMNGRCYNQVTFPKNGHQEAIVVFDTKREGLQRIDCPLNKNMYRYNYQQFAFGETGGSICYSFCDSKSMSFFMWALVDESCGSSRWVLRHKVKMQQIGHELPWTGDWFQFSVHCADDEAILVTHGKRLYHYHFKRPELLKIIKTDEFQISSLHPYLCR